MLDLPRSTEFNRKIPKNKFYQNAAIDKELKEYFVKNIMEVVWQNKISAATVNLKAAGGVEEIEVFMVRLRSTSVNEKVLREIDRAVPYHILFLLECEGKYRAAIAYKEIAAEMVKVGDYYQTPWLKAEELTLKLAGLDLAAAYENFVRQIAGSELTKNAGESLKNSVERSAREAVLSKKIKKLQDKMRKEPQLNRQMELRGEIKRLEKILEGDN